MSINQKEASWENEHSPQERGAVGQHGSGEQNANNIQKPGPRDPWKAVLQTFTEGPLGVSLHTTLGICQHVCRTGGVAGLRSAPDPFAQATGAHWESLPNPGPVPLGAGDQPWWVGLHHRN